MLHLSTNSSLFKDTEIAFLKGKIDAITRVKLVKIQDQRGILKWECYDMQTLLNQEKSNYRTLLDEMANDTTKIQSLSDEIDKIRCVILEDITSESTDSNASAGLKEVMKGRRCLAQNVQAVSESVNNFGIRNGRLQALVKRVLSVYTTIDVDSVFKVAAVAQ